MMGMMPPNKKIAAMILSTKKPDGSEETKAGDDVVQDDDMAMDSVASKIMGAIEAKDKKALIDGLKDFLAIADTDDKGDDQEAPPLEGIG